MLILTTTFSTSRRRENQTVGDVLYAMQGIAIGVFDGLQEEIIQKEKGTIIISSSDIIIIISIIIIIMLMKNINTSSKYIVINVNMLE